MDPTNQTPTPNPDPNAPLPAEPTVAVTPIQPTAEPTAPTTPENPVVEPVAPVDAASPEAPAAPEAQPAPLEPASTVTAAPTVVVSSPSVEPTPAEASPPDLTASAGPSHAASAPLDYISNPFMNSIRGLKAMLEYNPATSLLTGLYAMLLLLVGYIVYTIMLIAAASAGIGLVVILTLVFGLAYIIPFGTFFVLGGSSARGERVAIKEAYSLSAKKFLPMLGLGIMSSILLFVSYLLLFVPGLFVTGRILLAPIVMFEENLGPIAAIKRSFELTKGHVNEMLGALFAGALISGGSYGLLIGPLSIAPLVGRYQDLKALKESGRQSRQSVSSTIFGHWCLYCLSVSLL